MSRYLMTTWGRWAAVALLASGSACYGFDPSGTSCNITCGQNEACPSGLVCNANGRCGATMDTCDEQAPDAAIVDAALPGRRYAALGAGDHHACAIDVDGDLYCWGADGQGQVGGVWQGYGDVAHVLAPQRLVPPGLVGTWRELAVGATHSCALFDEAGGEAPALWCWGTNRQGELGGVGEMAGMNHVALPGTVVDVAAGHGFSCAIVTDTVGSVGDGVYCWGANNNAQLGRGEQVWQDTNGAADPMPVLAAFTGTPAPQTLTAGPSHACVNDGDGNTWCWGDTRYGAAGDDGEGNCAGNMNDCHYAPTPFSIARMAFHGLDAGGGNEDNHGFTCGLDVADHLVCWGSNDNLQLGVQAAASPANGQVVAIGGNATWRQVAAGTQHACAIASGANDGEVSCWGGTDDLRGVRGTGNQYMRPLPVAPTQTLVTDAEQVAVGTEFACAIVASGGIVCWGNNDAGQLGIGSDLAVRAPTKIDLPSGATGSWREVTAGLDFTCATVGDDEATARVYCWGSGQRGQVSGPGLLMADRRVPSDALVYGADELMGARSVVAGTDHACVISGTDVICWGADGDQQLGDTDQESVRATRLTSANPVVRLAAGGAQTCRLTDGGLRPWSCWGSGSFVDGLGTKATPTGQADLDAFVEVTVGDGFLCGRGATDSFLPAACRGVNAYGQRGDGTIDQPLGATNIAVTGGDVIDPPDGASAAFAVGTSSHRCALIRREDNLRRLMCWGDNGYGQAAIDPSSAVLTLPLEVTNGGDWRAVTVGRAHTCAVNSAGQLLCWGYNGYGQLGLGATSFDSTHEPMRVALPVVDVEVEVVTAGAYHTCAITKDPHELYCWGSNVRGAIGDGGGDQPVPRRVLDAE